MGNNECVEVDFERRSPVTEMGAVGIFAAVDMLDETRVGDSVDTEGGLKSTDI
jgi:hypothetical protein